MVFAAPLRPFYSDGTTPARLSGLSHLDNFIVTRKSCPLTGTLQKRLPTPTQTATPHTTGPLACIYPKSYRDNFVLGFCCNTRQFYHDEIDPAHLSGLFTSRKFYHDETTPSYLSGLAKTYQVFYRSLVEEFYYLDVNLCLKR
jgi:hypothetical protein